MANLVRTVRVRIEVEMSAFNDNLINPKIVSAATLALHDSNCERGRGGAVLASGWYRWRTRTRWRYAGLPMPRRLALWCFARFAWPRHG